MPKKDKKVKDFWQDQAKQFQGSHLATAPDTYYRQLEIKQISQRLKNGKKILDVGCGNGFSTIKFAEKFTQSKFIGIDYSDQMINFAHKNLNQKSKLKNRLQFHVGDVRHLSRLDVLKGKKFDYIISERCLINLLNWPEQKTALLELKKLLKPGGQIILCENTREGLSRLNKLRASFGLKPITVRWHNYYMPEKKLLALANKNFKIESAINIGSLYYIISRVVYAKLAQLEGKEPQYLHPINKIASRLPILGNYSPNFIFVLRKKHD